MIKVSVPVDVNVLGVGGERSQLTLSKPMEQSLSILRVYSAWAVGAPAYA